MGSLLPPPIHSGAFYTTAQIDATVLIAVVIYAPGIPEAWKKDDRLKWTWVVGVITLILLGITVAVIGAIFADSTPTPKWFNKEIRFGRNFIFEPSTAMLGAALTPLFFGILALAHGTYLRVTGGTPDGRHARPPADG